MNTLRNQWENKKHLLQGYCPWDNKNTDVFQRVCLSGECLIKMKAKVEVKKDSAVL